MIFPPKQVCPRISLSEAVKREARLYVYNLTIRGLYDETLISWEEFKNLICTQRESLEDKVNKLNPALQREFDRLLKIKTRGLHGEMAFNIYRGCDYTAAFKVALSYIMLGVKGHEFTLPDACLDASSAVEARCKGSKTIDVKTEGRKEKNEYVGLHVKNEWWISHAGRLDDFYTAVSERTTKNPPYEVLDYAILGYAFKGEVDSVTPMLGVKVDIERGYRFIHYYRLHPIDLLTPADYSTSETVRSRMKDCGF